MPNSNPAQINKIIYNVVPWWLIAGSQIFESILLIGSFTDGELSTLSSISKDLEHVDFRTFLDINDWHITRARKSYNVVVIKSLDEKNTLNFEQPGANLEKLLNSSSLIVLLEDNPFHIKNIFKHPLNIFKSFIFDVRLHQIRSRSNDIKIDKYGSFSYAGSPYESFPSRTYFTNKNPFLKTEKIKRLLLNSRFSRLFYSSQIWIVSQNQKLFIASLIDEVKANTRFRWERDEIKLLKLFSNNGKVILSLSSRIKNQPEYIIIIPIFEHVIQQRRNEQAVIKILRSCKFIAQYFVEEIIEGKMGNLKYFAMREFPGITVEHPNPGLNNMTKNVADVINRIASVNVTPKGVRSGKTVADVSLELIELLIARYPFHVKVIRDIGNILMHYRGLPLIGFMHGDAKLENFVLDEDTHHVIGIIDLELAQFPGIPLLDLFFLITDNYRILYKEKFFDAFNRIVKNDLTPAYRTYIKNYCRDQNITNDCKNLCLVLFFLHHFARREFFAEESSVSHEEFQPGCRLILQMLGDIPYDLVKNSDLR